MYRLVAGDMDETFLDSNHAIPEANIRALKRMKELGGSVRPLKRALVLVDAQRQRSGGMDLARRPQTRGKAAKERALVQGHAQRRGGLSREDRARARPTSGQSRALPRQRRGRVEPRRSKVEPSGGANTNPKQARPLYTHQPVPGGTRLWRPFFSQLDVVYKAF